MTIRSIPWWRIRDEINVGVRLVLDLIEGAVYSAIIGGFTVVDAIMCQAPVTALWSWFWIGFGVTFFVCAGLWIHARSR